MTISAPKGYQAEASYIDRCGWKVFAKPVNEWQHQPWTDCGYIGHVNTPDKELANKGEQAVNKYVSLGMVK